jgi:hypothetical protein
VDGNKQISARTIGKLHQKPVLFNSSEVEEYEGLHPFAFSCLALQPPTGLFPNAAATAAA